MPDDQKRKEIEELFNKNIDELYCMLGNVIPKSQLNDIVNALIEKFDKCMLDYIKEIHEHGFSSAPSDEITISETRYYFIRDILINVLNIPESVIETKETPLREVEEIYHYVYWEV